MSEILFPGVAALASIVPALVLSWRGAEVSRAVFWMVLAVACIGPVAEVVTRLHGVWQADFSTSLWTTAAASMALFMALAAGNDNVRRLAPLHLGVVMVLALMASIWQQAPMLPVKIDDAWLALHIVLAVATYALVTIAAEAAAAAFLQERALKAKRKPLLDGILPPVTACDGMVIRFLGWSEIILGLDIVSGAVLNLASGGPVIHLDHKTVFTLAAFVTIGALLFAAARYGMRGRRASRVVLVAYLLLTLGYPGVKFVTDVILN